MRHLFNKCSLRAYWVLGIGNQDSDAKIDPALMKLKVGQEICPPPHCWQILPVLLGRHPQPRWYYVTLVTAKGFTDGHMSG